MAKKEAKIEKGAPAKKEPKKVEKVEESDSEEAEDSEDEESEEEAETEDTEDEETEDSEVSEDTLKEAMEEEVEEVEDDDDEPGVETAGSKKLLEFMPAKVKVDLEHLKNSLAITALCEKAMLKFKKGSENVDVYAINHLRTLITYVSDSCVDDAGKPAKAESSGFIPIHNETVSFQKVIDMNIGKIAEIDFDGKDISVIDDKGGAMYFTPQLNDYYRQIMETFKESKELVQFDKSTIVYGNTEKERYENFLKFDLDTIIKLVTKAEKLGAEYHVFMIENKQVNYRCLESISDIEMKKGGKIPITPKEMSVKGKHSIVVRSEFFKAAKLAASDDITINFKDDEHPVFVVNADKSFIVIATPFDKPKEDDYENQDFSEE